MLTANLILPFALQYGLAIMETKYPLPFSQNPFSGAYPELAKYTVKSLL